MQSENLPSTETNAEVSPKTPIKIWADPAGFSIGTIKRAISEQPLPHKFVRELDRTKADIVHMDGEPEHFEDTHCIEPAITTHWNNLKKGSRGAWCPYQCKIDTKKRTAIMYGFAEHLFPGMGKEHPKSWLVPEEEAELKKHMVDTGAIIICKPDQGYCGGGIFLAQTVEDLKWAEGTTYICQTYINNPLNFGERQRKIDYRVSYLNVDKTGDYDEVYFQNRCQGRIAVDTYKPLSAENKDDVTTHITFYPELFSDPTKYILTEDLENFSEVCNFQSWEQVCKYFHSHGHQNFEEKILQNFKDLTIKQCQVARPYYKMIWAAKGIMLGTSHDYIYNNLYGSDVLVDEDYNCHLIEFNSTPSCGDYCDSQGIDGPINPVFQKWGMEAIQPWLEQARNMYDGVEFGDKTEIGSYTKVLGKGIQPKYKEEGDVIERLFNFFLLLTTGSAKLPHYDAQVWGERLKTEAWFPLTITEEQFMTGFRAINARVAEETLKAFYDKFHIEEQGIYLVACAMVKLYMREECLEMLKRCE